MRITQISRMICEILYSALIRDLSYFALISNFISKYS